MRWPLLKAATLCHGRKSIQKGSLSSGPFSFSINPRPERRMEMPDEDDCDESDDGDERDAEDPHCQHFRTRHESVNATFCLTT